MGASLCLLINSGEPSPVRGRVMARATRPLTGLGSPNGTNVVALANIKRNTRRCVGELLKSQFKDSSMCGSPFLIGRPSLAICITAVRRHAVRQCVHPVSGSTDRRQDYSAQTRWDAASVEHVHGVLPNGASGWLRVHAQCQ